VPWSPPGRTLLRLILRHEILQCVVIRNDRLQLVSHWLIQRQINTVGGLPLDANKPHRGPIAVRIRGVINDREQVMKFLWVKIPVAGLSQPLSLAGNFAIQ